MMKLITNLTTIIVALTLGLPIVGCQQEKKDTEKEKVIDVQVGGHTEVKVERTKKPDEKDGHLDVEVKHHPTQEPAEQHK